MNTERKRKIFNMLLLFIVIVYIIKTIYSKCFSFLGIFNLYLLFGLLFTSILLFLKKDKQKDNSKKYLRQLKIKHLI